MTPFYTRFNKGLAAVVILTVSLLSTPLVDGRPCDEPVTSSSMHTYTTPANTRSHTQTHHYHHSGAITKVITKTRTLTATETDTVYRTRTATSSVTLYSVASPSAYSTARISSAPSSSQSTSVAYTASPSATATAATGNGQCSTGPIQCCNSVQSASSLGSGSPLDTLGISLDDLSTPVGLTCSPLNVLGLGSGANCAGTAVCCSNNNYNGLINIGCIPIVLQL